VQLCAMLRTHPGHNCTLDDLTQRDARFRYGR
jgi:hypothetical protein